MIRSRNQTMHARTRPDECFDMALPSDAHSQFLSLVESHQRALWKVCWTYGRSSHDRDDLFQEIVGRLWTAFAAIKRS